MKYGLILAAGRGTRMKPLTDYRPKALLPEISNSLLLRQIAFMRKYVQNIIVTYGYLGEQIVKNKDLLGIDILVNTDGFGNAHALSMLSAQGIKCRIPIITCDNLMEINLFEVFNEDALLSPGITIVPIIQESIIPGDRIEIGEDRIIKRIEPTLNSPILASGLQIVDLDYCKSMPRDDFHSVWNTLKKRKRLRVASSFASNWSAYDDTTSLSHLTRIDPKV